jgi:hypothetical protein
MSQAVRDARGVVAIEHRGALPVEVRDFSDGWKPSASFTPR